jgi:glutathione synthase
MRIGFAITRAAAIDVTWTTVSLIDAALSRGWTAVIIEPWDWQVNPDGQLVTRAHVFDRLTSRRDIARALSQRLADRRMMAVSDLDLLLLRASPFNQTVMAFATLASQRGVRVENSPRGLLAVCNKSWLAAQAEVHTPPTLVTRSRASAHHFLTQQPHGVVVKPAQGSGGRGVSRVRPDQADKLDTAFDCATAQSGGHVVVQAWLQEAEAGEKRVLWLDGALIGGYLRQRAPGEFRHNLKRGAQPHPTQITERERNAVSRLTPALVKAGIRLAGLDLIGEWITEVNALNPGGVHHADRLHGTNLADTILDRLAQPTADTRPQWVHPVH